MGLSDWIKGRRESAEAVEAARVKERHASFGDLCQRLIAIQSAPPDDHTGSPYALFPRHDGFAAEVVPVIATAEALAARLKGADPSTAPEVLSEFGLSSAVRTTARRLAKMVDAADALVARSHYLVTAWVCTGEDDRAQQAADVAEAARQLLAATRDAKPVSRKR